MCLPLLAVAAVASIGLGAANTVMSANAAGKAAKSQKEQLAIQAQTNAANSELAKQNAATALSVADTNAKKLLALTAENATARQAITDINVGLATSISNFNDQVADGQGKLLIGRGEVEAAAAERNAQTATMNASYQERAAQDSLDASHKDEQASDLNYARLKSTQRATLAANGVTLDEGSALRIQTDSDYFKDVDGATIHANGIRAAMGYRQQETNSLIEAGQDEIGAKVARINAATEAAQVSAQAAGAKMASDRDILNMKLSTSFEILQASENAKVNAANILNQGRVEATNYEMQSSGFAGAAAQETVAGNGINPGQAALGAFIGGASSVAGKWFAYQQSGVFG
jgi:hypothetical protein